MHTARCYRELKPAGIRVDVPRPAHQRWRARLSWGAEEGVPWRRYACFFPSSCPAYQTGNGRDAHPTGTRHASPKTHWGLLLALRTTNGRVASSPGISLGVAPAPRGLRQDHRGAPDASGSSSPTHLGELGSQTCAAQQKAESSCTAPKADQLRLGDLSSVIRRFTLVHACGPASSHYRPAWGRGGRLQREYHYG